MLIKKNVLRTLMKSVLKTRDIWTFEIIFVHHIVSLKEIADSIVKNVREYRLRGLSLE